MHKSQRMAVFAVLLSLVFLAACGSERKAEEALGRAEAVAAAGNLESAIPLLEALRADYPESKAAVRAGTELESIRQTLLIREHTEIVRTLESVRDVLEGFRSVYDRYPASLADLDNGDFSFDGPYLAGIVPKNSQVTLLFAAAPPYRIWGFKNGQDEGVLLDTSHLTVRGADRAEALEILKSAGPAVTEIGALTAYVQGL